MCYFQPKQNGCVHNTWNHLQGPVNEFTIFCLRLINDYKPKWVGGIEISRFNPGKQAPVVRSVQVDQIDDDGIGEIRLLADVEFLSDSLDCQLTIKPLPPQLSRATCLALQDSCALLLYTKKRHVHAARRPEISSWGIKKIEVPIKLCYFQRLPQFFAQVPEGPCYIYLQHDSWIEGPEHFCQVSCNSRPFHWKARPPGIFSGNHLSPNFMVNTMLLRFSLWRSRCKALCPLPVPFRVELLTSIEIKETKNYIGRGSSPYINSGKGDALAQKSCESPPPRRLQKEHPKWGFGGLLEASGSITWLQE
eukprot:377843-Pelagomonas_calceolata.AAC.1